AGDCGPLPTINHAEPQLDTAHLESFTVGSQITYRCTAGYMKRPSLSDTIQCLSNSQWSQLPEFCGRSCPALPRMRFARVSPEHEMQNFFPVGITVKYVCRPGYENTTEQLLTSTCLDNLTWSEVPELCQRQSCGIPTNPEHGEIMATDYLFGTRASVVCDRG
ncbi:DAF factor, partial [Zapornia atra]|nr:DAF factor [Zapornia atra]